MVSWFIESDAFRTAMLRFLDVFPTLSEPSSVPTAWSNIRRRGGRAPGPLRFALKAAASGGRAGVALLAAMIRYGIEKLGRQFIVGRDKRSVLKGLTAVRQKDSRSP